MKYLAESEFCFLPGFFNFQNQHHTLESGLQFGVWLPIKSEQLLFLFPQKYGKLAWIHLKLRLAYYCNPVVNGDPQKAAQMDRYIEWKSRRICIWIFPGDWERFSIFI